MNPPPCLPPARFLGPVLLACLLPASCDPVADPAAAPPPRYTAPLPEPRRTASPSPDTARWLAAWRELRSRLSPLEETLTGLQKVHLDNHFDSFLTLDPATISRDQLCTLFHFLERGYFTVERRILIHLLDRRLERKTSPPAIPEGGGSKLRDRLIAAMQRDELRMVDLETAIDFYNRTGTGDLKIPQSLSGEEEAELRTAVAGMLQETRETITALDARIAALNAEVSGTPPGP